MLLGARQGYHNVLRSPAGARTFINTCRGLREMGHAADLLQSLRDDPADERALAGLMELEPSSLADSLRLIGKTRRSLRDRGALEVASKLLDLEIRMADDPQLRAELLVEQGTLQSDALAADALAEGYYRKALELRPNLTEARESLETLALIREHAAVFADKLLLEAESATDRELASHLYTSAALMQQRVDPGSPIIEAHLRRALELVPRNPRAASLLRRRLRAAERWSDLAVFLGSRREYASGAEDRASLLVELADALTRAGSESDAKRVWREVLDAQPGHDKAMSIVVEELEAGNDFEGLVEVFEKALSVRKAGDRDAEVGVLMQLGMLCWKRLEEADRADEYFRRVRKLDPANPAVLQFYREYYPARGDAHKLLQLLRQAARQLGDDQEAQRLELTAEMARVAEDQLGNLEKAIDAWKQVQRSEPSSAEAKESLKRLYRKTEKWNALLDLMKDEIEGLPDSDIRARIAGLEEIVEIYRDRLNLPTMVISTYNTILALDPGNSRALAALAGKYEQLGRWNDLIGVLAREAESLGSDVDAKVAVLRRMATLWVEHFGNYAQAIGPLEELLALRPGDPGAIAQLKDIYERRRQWRPLLELLDREALHLELGDRRERYKAMAKLATERLGDNRLGIELWNRAAEIDGPDGTSGIVDPEVVDALTTLYEREKRYVALAAMYRRRRALAGTDSRFAVQILERLGSLLAERLGAPDEAAVVYREILELEPANGRALRTLRELYAHSGSFAELEAMFAELGQWSELVDSLSTIADRVTDHDRKVALLLRAAQIAGEHFESRDRAARAYERLLSVDAKNVDAARALVPLYRDLGKWSRLLAVHELILEQETDPGRRLATMLELRELCEHRLQSKAMAFEWIAKAYTLDPTREGLVDELERLASQADAWEEAVEVLDARAQGADVPAEERLRLYRLLGRIAASRLHQPGLARSYQQRVLELDPDDRGASQALEDIAREQADWPNLLAIYRRRATSESDTSVRAEQLFRIAHIEETQVGDRAAAARTYEEILAVDPQSRRAVRALAKLREESGDIEGLVAALRREIELVGEVDAKVELQLRVGRLYEEALAEPKEAVAAYREALTLAPQRAQVQAALESFLEPKQDVDASLRAEVAGLLYPILEQSEDAGRLARVIEVLRVAADSAQATVFDKRLVELYARLGERARAWAASARVLQANPLDGENREELLRLGAELERWHDTAELLHTALEGLESAGADVGVMREVACSMAEIFEVRLGDIDRGEAAWRRVLAIDPTERSAYDALQRILRSGERYRELRDLLAARAEHTSDADRRKDLVLSIAEINQDILGDVDGAIAAYSQVLEIDPSLGLAYKALERLFETGENWPALDALLARELDYVDSDADHVDLTSRRAVIHAHRLADASGAVDLAEDVLARVRDHSVARALLEELLRRGEERTRIAKILEPLYREEGKWRELSQVVRAQLETAAAPSAKIDLLAEVAAVQEERLGNPSEAFATWREALGIDPTDERPRRSLMRLAALLGAWDGAAEVFEAALHGLEGGARAALLSCLGEIYDRHLGDAEGAIRAFSGQVELDPKNPETARPALQALDRLYEAYDRWNELAPVVRQEVEWAESPEERRELLTRLAGLYEHNLGDAEAAIGAWREVLGDEPDDARALDALERLFIAGDRPRDLVEVIRRRVEAAADDVDRREQLRRLAALYETKLDNLAEATACLLEVLDFSPEDAASLADLARLYRVTERYSDLFEILERRLAGEEDSVQRLEITSELGNLLLHQLGRKREALERFAEVLEVDPTHAVALAAVEEAVTDAELLARASEVLEPIYESNEQHARLAELLLLVADSSDEPRERLRRLLAVAAIRDGRLSQPEAAFTAYARAVADAMAEPELADIVAQLERLATALGRRATLIDIYRSIAPDVLDGQLQRHLYLMVADLAWTEKSDVALAREYYQLVLDVTPDDEGALGALEDIYRQTEDWEQLVLILSRRAEQAGDAAGPRIAALGELAAVCDEKLGRAEDAVVAWEQVLELAPDSRAALDALESLYRRNERWHDLAELLERRIGYTFDTREAVAIRFELGSLYATRLSDPDAAVASYSAVLENDGSHRGALAALEQYLDDPATRAEAAKTLEPIYVSRQNWPRLVRIYEIKLEAAEDRQERLMLTRYIARLYEDQLEDLDGAFRWYGKVFRENPGDRSIRDQLMRLASVLESWEQLANVYQEFLDDETEDSDEVLEVAATLAEIFDRRLLEVERAHVAYRRILSAEPDQRAAFDRLEAMLSRAGRWYALVELYHDTIEATMVEPRRIELHLRAARIYEEQLHDRARAVDEYRAIAEVDPEHAVAVESLDRLYQALERWQDLADFLAERVDACEADPRQANAYRLRLAELLETHLKDIGTAIEHYHVALSYPGANQALFALERLVLLDDQRERIAALLEPLYRKNDWWQKLVIILDAQLEFVDDPSRRRSMLREIAQIHESRGGDENLALRALSRAWKDDIHDEEVYGELVALVSKLGAWDALVDVLEEGIKDSYDYDQVAVVLARLGEAHETHRNDVGAAIACWRRLLEVRDDDVQALAELDRLYESQVRWAEQVKIILRRAELADDRGVQVVLLHRAARTLDEKLSDAEGAIAEYRNVLGVVDDDLDALDALERLYRTTEMWPELAQTLTRKLELETEPAERRRLRFAAADVFDGKLSDAFEAVAMLQAELEESPQDVEALSYLDRLYGRESMWAELIEVLDRRIELSPDAAQQAELGFRVAGVLEEHLLDVEGAINRYATVLGVMPVHRGARSALDRLAKTEDSLWQASDVLMRLYRSEQAHDALADLYERRLRSEGADPDVRLQLYRELAGLQESNRHDIDAAFAVWARALAEFPDRAELRSQLERLAGQRGSWGQLAKVYEERLAATVDSEVELVYADELGRIYDEDLGDLRKAADKYRRALAVAVDEPVALAKLASVFTRSESWSQLAEILERQAQVAESDAQQVDYLFLLADVREQKLGELPLAVDALREVLDRQPHHEGARSALWRLLGNDRLRGDIIVVLEPLFEEEQNAQQLADLLGFKLSVTDDRFERAGLYARIAELAEASLADPVRALDACGGWLAEDPQSEEALHNLQRLGEVTGRWDEVAARLRGILDSGEAEMVRSLLLARLGGTYLDRLGDVDRAEKVFRDLLALEPDSQLALSSLQRIYRGHGDLRRLSEMLKRLAAVVESTDERHRYLKEVGELREQLGDVAGAAEVWRDVLELDESDRSAHQHLCNIYQSQGRWEELIEVLALAANHAADAAEEKQLRARIALTYADQLGDLEEAAAAWQKVLDVDPADLGALVSLEAIWVQRGEWDAVQEVLLRRLEVVSGDQERIAVLGRLYEVAVEHRESIDEGVQFLSQILEIDARHGLAFEHLSKLLRGAERWHELVDLYERMVEVYDDDPSGRAIGLLAELADLWEGPLANPDAASEVLERVLEKQPGYVPALTRLARIYEAAADWERCAEVLERALALGPSGPDAADLHFRMGAVARAQSDDAPQALAHYGEALRFQPTHVPAMRAVAEIAREREDWPTLAEMLAREVQLTEDADHMVALAAEVADVYENRLGQLADAVPILEVAVRVAPSEPRILGPLADAYFNAGRVVEAAPMYESLAEEAKKSRRMKDLARYQQRIGGIFEAAGNLDKAKAAYKDAFRVDPTNLATMAGLGRLHIDAQEWEDARRIYRSMVLQNIDPSVGISKAEIYYNLGYIHVQLGEPRKAKNMFQRGLELEPDDARLRAGLESVS